MTTVDEPTTFGDDLSRALDRLSVGEIVVIHQSLPASVWSSNVECPA
jgi:hypothetical protein